MHELLSGPAAVVVIVTAMAVVALVEVVVPLRPRGPWHRAHLGPNLSLTALTFTTNLLMNAALLGLIVVLERSGVGLLPWLALPPLAAGLLAVMALDLAFYAAHVSWHAVPLLWRFHAVHHADPAVDVTTTIRQHPIEGVLRYVAMTVTVLLVGPTVTAFAIYRLASAVNGLLEHANVRAPRSLDWLLSLVTTWPHMHKVHHSRTTALTNSNYGNLFSLWDRLFGTFTPSWRGTTIAYGLDGTDRPDLQTTAGLLAQPFRPAVVDPRGTRATGRSLTPSGRSSR
jgi:sterol desaturase/sphingolipid hydroxylase (fatty acid hydroxylase superfamily)